VAKNVKKLVDTVFDERVAYNYQLVEKLKNLMQNSEIVKICISKYFKL
jgi:hypothetical protein